MSRQGVKWLVDSILWYSELPPSSQHTRVGWPSAGSSFEGQSDMRLKISLATTYEYMLPIIKGVFLRLKRGVTHALAAPTTLAEM